MTSFLITAPADSGNIDVLAATDPGAVRLRMVPDGRAPFHQWFHFLVTGARGTALTMTIENAGDSSYTPGWKGYRAVACEGGDDWVRVPTSYEDGKLTIQHTPESGVCRYAYFAPYGVSRLDRFLNDACRSALCDVDALGLSLDEQPMTRLRMGKGPRQVWVIARQHPGESMGSWWMEGFLPRLLGSDDQATRLREAATVHVVPMMNPDGVLRGHLRTNAAGTDLNRAWAEPSRGASPEVLCVREAMEASGCDLFLDVHGDEVIANNFIAGAEGIPRWSDRLADLKHAYEAALLDVTDAFQTKQGYPIPKPGQANPKIATNWVGERFDCLSMTLEMPFKDAAVVPDPVRGWSPERSAQLGRDCLEAMVRITPQLR